MALQWRAAVPSGMWLEALDSIAVTRTWTDDGRRELILQASEDNSVDRIDPFWSHGFGPDWDFRHANPGSSFSDYFPLGPALKSMQLSNALSDDALRHALEPLLNRLPEAVVSFMLHGPDDTESVAHSLIHLWLASAMSDQPQHLLQAYERAVTTVTSGVWGPSGDTNGPNGPAIAMILRWLASDANRLPSAEVLRLVRTIRSSPAFDNPSHLLPTVECLLADTVPFVDDRDLLIDEVLFDATAFISSLSPEGCLRLLTALSYARSAALKTTLAAIDERLTAPEVHEQVQADPDLAARLDNARDRLTDIEPPT
jgi:hypothetical protein